MNQPLFPQNSPRVRVKICGITRREDALAAVALGADAIGLVFYRQSPRAVSIAQAQAMVHALPPFVTVTGLFVDAPEPEVRAVLDQVRVDLLQFHGDEPPGDCNRYGKPYIKAVRMRGGVDVAAIASQHADASGLLLDSYRAGVAGGTGDTFDWTRVPRDLDKPVILAGGLTPENVAEAIRQVQPYAVDVSGGVETAKGIKSADKIAAFMRGVYSVNIS
ncbi:MAG: phosphoribosylanthranilate isomerase [Pseudomonadota bacterium]